VDPPEGRGTAAVYRYRHLLQVLAIKLRQMEGASLDALAREFADQTGDALERRVAAVLGPGLPAPDELGALQSLLPARGRSARAIRPARLPESAEPPARVGARSVLMRRVQIAPGAELALEATHPLFRHVGAEEAIARSVAAALEEAAADLDSTGR
ncbi:MAG TPA: hypothetical protein VLL51_06490, partial [Gemmatimonadales bacterium]|nr:hypothetical protein [Gemmatimonadales bacterium]